MQKIESESQTSDCCSIGQSLNAILVVRTVAFVLVVGVTRHTNVTTFGVSQSIQCFSADNDANANTSADSNIAHRINITDDAEKKQ